MKTLATLLALFCAAAFAQQKGTFKDPRDGKVYKTVTIGEQIWFAENLNFKIDGSRCYNNDASNCNKYGRLYTYFQADGNVYANIDGICPTGWRLPIPAEWNTLAAATKAPHREGEFLKSKSGWGSNGNGKDTYGFAALPGGGMSPDNEYAGAGEIGYWWVKDLGDGFMKNVMFFTDESNALIIGETDPNTAASVRCVKYVITQKNVAVQKGAFTDSRDGKTYETVKIGTKTWMAENLNYDAKGSKCYGDDPENCKKYGRLYDWASAHNVDEKYNNEMLEKKEEEKKRGICPSGWSLPIPNDVKLLLEEIGTVAVSPTVAGGMTIRSYTAGAHLKSKSGWISGNGKDSYGFAALPGGSGGWGGVQHERGMGEVAVWWGWGQFNAGTGVKMVVVGGDEDESVVFGPDSKDRLFSVRCVKD